MIRTARPLSLAPRTFRQCRLIANPPPQIPSHVHGHLSTSQSPIVSKLHFFNSVTGNGAQIPTYRVIDGEGKPIDGAEVPEVRFFSFKNVTLFIKSQIDEAFARKMCVRNMELQRYSMVNLRILV